MDRFTPFADKMRAAGLSDAAIRAFEGNFRALERNETGMIPEADIAPVQSLPSLAGLPAADPDTFARLLRSTVVIKLNGGLGTGMGLEKAKSLLEVREGLTFLDLIAKQVMHLRAEAGGSGLPRFLLMNSFSTSEDTLSFLENYPALGGAADLELMQNRVPKVLASDLTPLAWPQNPDMEWCPPGHGDIYATLAGSGLLDQLLAQGVTCAFVSNSDNLGAVLHPGLLQWFMASGAPFLMEVTRRTEADRKGGHLALRPRDGRLILRESAQCPKADEAAFQDTERHRFFNTNNLWVRLDKLKETLDACGGLIPLPMIRNSKTADPRDKQSPAVFQLETAMGAAIESFAGAAAIDVGRERFAPVKTTADLLALRSDAYQLTPDHRIELHPSRDNVPPVIQLDDRFKLVDALEDLLRGGVPSLRSCTRLSVQGPVSFAGGVNISGEAEFRAAAPVTVPAGDYSGVREL